MWIFFGFFLGHFVGVRGSFPSILDATQIFQAKDGDGVQFPNRSAPVFPPVNCKSIAFARSNVTVVQNSDDMLTILPTRPYVHLRHPAQCVLAFVYSKSCPFSRLAAPHFIVLARLFPGVTFIALDVQRHFTFSVLNKGILGVPALILFHNGRPAAKFNASRYTLNAFTEFLVRLTGRSPERMSRVDAENILKEDTTLVDSLVDETDWMLVFSWCVTLAALSRPLSRSRLFRLFSTAILDQWRLAAQYHDHHE